MKKKYLISLMALSLAGCTASSEVSTPVETSTPTPEVEVVEEVKEPEVYTASLFMVGDALIHGAVYYDAMQADGSYDFHEQLARVGELSEGYDLKYYNQETILGGVELGLSSYPMFNSPVEVGQAMVDYGFNLVSLANNHSLDRFEAGIINSMNFWNAQEGVAAAGTNLSWEDQDKIEVHEINGISYVFLSWTYGCNGLTAPEGKEYLVNVYTDQEEKMLEQVRRANEMADVVMIAMHWGDEYSTSVNAQQERLAVELSEAGADIIIGSHPHVIQPVSWVNDGKTICFYSLGNMISAQDVQARLVEMAGALTITKTVLDDEVEIQISDVKADLLYDYYRPGFTGFKVVTFDELTTDMVWNYQEVYDEYVQIITALDQSIQVGLD